MRSSVKSPRPFGTRARSVAAAVVVALAASCAPRPATVDDCDAPCHAIVHQLITPPARSVAEWETHCGGVSTHIIRDWHNHTERVEPYLVDGTPLHAACYATFEIACPPSCATYKLLIDLLEPGVHRVGER